jgi:hypothetical protein
LTIARVRLEDPFSLHVSYLPWSTHAPCCHSTSPPQECSKVLGGVQGRSRVHLQAKCTQKVRVRPVYGEKGGSKPVKNMHWQRVECYILAAKQGCISKFPLVRLSESISHTRRTHKQGGAVNTVACKIGRRFAPRITISASFVGKLLSLAPLRPHVTAGPHQSGTAHGNHTRGGGSAAGK